MAVIGKEGEDYQPALAAASGGAAASAAPEKEAKPAKRCPKKRLLLQKQLLLKLELPEGAKEIRMPLLSDTMTEGKIVSWNKKVGDLVKSDDVLADVETDKATMEVVGYEEGTLLYIGVEAGNAAKINEIIAIVGKPGTDVSAYVAAEKAGGNAAPTATAPAEETATPTAAATQETETAATPSDSRVKASPLSQKISCR